MLPRQRPDVISSSLFSAAAHPGSVIGFKPFLVSKQATELLGTNQTVMRQEQEQEERKKTKQACKLMKPFEGETVVTTSSNDFW